MKIKYILCVLLIPALSLFAGNPADDFAKKFVVGKCKCQFVGKRRKHRTDALSVPTQEPCYSGIDHETGDYSYCVRIAWARIFALKQNWKLMVK